MKAAIIDGHNADGRTRNSQETVSSADNVIKRWQDKNDDTHEFLIVFNSPFDIIVVCYDLFSRVNVEFTI